MRRAFLIFLLFPLSLFCQEVEMRGFLYTAPDGRLILADEPNLKTCCVGSPHKKQEQVTIIGGEHLPKTNRAVTLKGTFSPTDRTLQNPTLIEKNYFSEIISLVLLMVIGVICWNKRKTTNDIKDTKDHNDKR